jgi:hypothetical protein
LDGKIYVSGKEGALGIAIPEVQNKKPIQIIISCEKVL